MERARPAVAAPYRGDIDGLTSLEALAVGDLDLERGAFFDVFDRGTLLEHVALGLARRGVAIGAWPILALFGLADDELDLVVATGGAQLALDAGADDLALGLDRRDLDAFVSSLGRRVGRRDSQKSNSGTYAE